MPYGEPKSLQRIKSFDQLLAYLRDELDWPIDEMDIEDLTFDYEPEELGLDPKVAAKIRAIKQLRPLTSKQPFGIFFVEFEPKRLPVTALRRILARLVTKKRATAERAERQSWDQDDLIFVSAYGEDDQRRIDFAHFADDAAAGLPTLRVLGWDADDTAMRVDLVEQRLKSHLAWDEDEPVDEWRERWRRGFVWEHRQVPRTTKDLVNAMALLAKRIRDKALDAMGDETEKGPIRKLHTAFRDSLIHDLDERAFADMYAQSITYGMLSARISRPAGLVTEDIAAMVTSTSPFLRELMEEFIRVGGRHNSKSKGDGIDFDLLGVNEVVELLRQTDMEPIVADFGRARAGEDPVIHFYEDFMKQYDAQQRVKRGIYYTPKPVVSFIVRSVDEILREEFGLPLGLADTTTWGEMAELHARAGGNPSPSPGSAGEGRGGGSSDDPRPFAIPDTVKPTDAFVQILDPACGTGTFLVEVIDLIYHRMRDHWLAEGHMELQIETLWNDYVADHLLPRLYGFELMMAPYAICHMKVGLKLKDTGYRFRSSERLRVYLTNSLEPTHDLSEMLEFVAPFLAHEARAASKMKRSLQPTVLIGNPPYAKASSNRTAAAEALVQEYKDEVRGETNVQPLSDDYVKFIGLCHSLIKRDRGTIGLITNRSYLHGLIHRGLRHQLFNDFDAISIIDLHGDSNVGEHPPDDLDNENVFDIQQGVAVSLLLRTLGGPAEVVQHADVWGTRQRKYDALGHPAWPVSELRPDDPNWFFVPHDSARVEEQSEWQSLSTAFEVSGMGVKSRRDHFLIDVDRDVLIARMRTLKDAGNVESVRSVLGVEDNAQWTLSRMQSLLEAHGVEERIRQILYRPFDLRFIWYHKDAIERGDARWPVMQHVFNGGLSLLSARQSLGASFDAVFVANGLVEMKAAESTRGCYVMPLLKTWNCETAVSNVSVEEHDEVGWFECTYAILHSPAYRVAYSSQLAIDFPRVPVVFDSGLFAQLRSVGADLVALHLLEDDYPHASWNQPGAANCNPLAHPITTFHDEGDREVRKVGETGKKMSEIKNGKGRVSINHTAWFDGLPEAVWNFHIGGYQVCHKWLKDRKGRTLSQDDIAHYHKIVVALNETIRLMKEIDEVIDQHGGWPGAFVTDRKQSSPIQTTGKR